MRPSFDHGRLDAAVDGDRLAVQHVLGTLPPMVVRYCRAHIDRAACGYRAADDVAQEVLLAVLLALPRYRGTEARLFSFTIGIAKHKIADFYRERRRDRTVPFGNPPDLGDRLPPPEQLVLQAELGTQLSSLLDTPTPNQREILVLRVIVGLSTEDTARAMSATPGSVRVAQHRALTALRRRLAQGEGVDRLPREPARRRRSPRPPKP